MLPFIVKLFLSHSANKIHRNFSPAASINWLIKLPVLNLNVPREIASDVSLYYQIVSKPFYEQNSSKFSPAAGMGINWFIKLPVLHLNHLIPFLKFREKVPQMLAFITNKG